MIHDLAVIWKFYVNKYPKYKQIKLKTKSEVVAMSCCNGCNPHLQWVSLLLEVDEYGEEGVFIISCSNSVIIIISLFVRNVM